MAVMYRLRQDVSEESSTKGKWFAVAYIWDVIDTKKICAKIQENVSVKASDVKAVIEELINVMTDALQDGKRVKLNGFGSFKVGLKSKGADSREEFTAAKHIVGSRVNFLPETTWRAADGNKRQRVFLSGLTVTPLLHQGADDSNESNSGETGTGD